MLVLDDERLGAVRRVLAGVAVDDDHLGLNVIADAAAGGDSLCVGHEHTLQHLHSAEVWRPRLALRGGLVEGAPPAERSVDRARAVARKILDTHTVAPLPAAVQRTLTEIIGAYAIACATADPA